MFKGIKDKGLLPSHSLHFHSFHAGDKCNCEWVFIVNENENEISEMCECFEGYNDIE